MNKWYGKIGFADNVETAPSVFSEIIEEHSYYGDVLRNNRRLQNSDGANSNITVSNQISVVADAYLNNHFYNIRWIEFMGVKWTATEVDASTPPRLIITLGEVWNEDES